MSAVAPALAPVEDARTAQPPPPDAAAETPPAPLEQLNSSSSPLPSAGSRSVMDGYLVSVCPSGTKKVSLAFHSMVPIAEPPYSMSVDECATLVKRSEECGNRPLPYNPPPPFTAARIPALSLLEPCPVPALPLPYLDPTPTPTLPLPSPLPQHYPYPRPNPTHPHPTPPFTPYPTLTPYPSPPTLHPPLPVGTNSIFSVRNRDLAFVSFDPPASMCYCCAASGEPAHYYKEPSFSRSPGWRVHIAMGDETTDADGGSRF